MIVINVQQKINLKCATKEFTSYVKEHCSNYTLEEALYFVNQGYKAVKYIKHYDNLSTVDYSKFCKNDQRVRLISSVAWYFMYLAVEQGKGFHQGTFVFFDEGHRIVEFFKKSLHAYRRWSSHFPGRVPKGHDKRNEWFNSTNAVDTHCLPAKKRTVIFDRVEVLSGETYSFLKIEDYGTRGWHIFPHTVGYLKTFLPSLLPSIFGKHETPGFQEEDVHPKLANSFKLLKHISLNHKEEIAQIKKFGISAMMKFHKSLSRYLSIEATDPDVRTGNEVILTKSYLAT